MSAVPNKPKLTLTSDNYERVRRLAERGELTELKRWIKVVLRYKPYRGYNKNSLDEGELGIIRSRPVIKAAQNGHQHIVEYFIAEFSDIVEYQYMSSHTSSDATTALHSAAEKGHVGILKLLTDPSIEVNCRNTSTGWTSLHSAVSSGHEDAIQYLISCQADVNAADTNGRTPLHEVILRHTSGEHGKDYAWLCRVVEMLLQGSASICQADHDGRTAFHDIAQLDKNTSQQLLKLLLKSNPQLAWKVLHMPSKGQRYTELPAILYAAEWRNEPFIRFITAQPECSPTIAVDALLALRNVQYVLLTIRERTFGIGSRATIQYLWELGHDLCKKSCFAEAEQLYTKALKMMVLNITGEYSQPGCYKSIEDLHTTLHTEYRFDKLVSHGQNSGYKPNFFQIVSYGLELTKHITKHLTATRYLCFTTHLVFSLLGLWAYEEWKTTGCLTNEINKLGGEMVKNFSVLQLLSYSYACTGEPLYIPPEEHDKYISFMVSKILHWEAGSLAINAMDNCGDRPLHEAVNQSSKCERVRTQCIHKSGVKRINFVTTLVNNGAHLDAVNSHGRAAYQDYWDNLKIKRIVTPPKPLPLTCLASRAVAAGDIPYNELTCIPSRIKAFVALHDRNAKRCNFLHSI